MPSQGSEKLLRYPEGWALNYLGRANNKPPFQLATDAILYLKPEYIQLEHLETNSKLL